MRALSVLGLTLVGLLFFIWPIPHTIAARNLLMLASLALLGCLAYKAKLGWPALYAELKMPARLGLAFIGWLLVCALVISSETSWSLGEIAGQWGKGLLALGIGVLGGGLAIQGKLFSRNSLLLMVFTALFAHVLYLGASDVVGFLGNGVLARRVSGLTEGPDKANYLTNMALAILAAEVFFRVTFHRRLLPLNNFLLVAAIGLTGFSSYIEGMRNGMVAVLFLFASIGGLYWLENRQKMKTGLLVGSLAGLIAVVGIFGYASFKADQRWQTLFQTIPVALDTAHNKAWLDFQKYPLPTLADGRPVEVSAYLRAAWFKEGVVALMEHPLGIGFGRNAFGHAIKEKYGEGGGHSHSGLLDLAIGTGIPGMLLWLGFLLSLLYLAARRYFQHKNPYALILFFLVTGYSARMVVDSIIRDHMLEQFMFLVGMFGVLMLHEKRTAPEERNGAHAV
ncbi:MAG: O-antigen ligase family protein [Pseudomonadota bacterium]